MSQLESDLHIKSFNALSLLPKNIHDIDYLKDGGYFKYFDSTPRFQGFTISLTGST